MQAKLQAKVMVVDFLGGPVVKTLPANAGNTGLIPGPGGFPMLWGSQARGATNTEPMLCNRRNHHNEKPRHHSQMVGLHLLQLERPT